MNKSFFKGNRQKIINILNQDVLVLAGYSAVQKNNDTSYKFEQESNFWYLTGIESPNWWLIIDCPRQETYLVKPSIDESLEIFEGSLSAEKAQKISGVEKILSHMEALSLLERLARQHKTVHTISKDPYARHYSFELNPGPQKLQRRLKRTFEEVKDCRMELAKLRAIKQPTEIKVIKQAIDLTIGGFDQVKNKLASLKHEYEVEAVFSYHFRSSGATGHAYDPIVACGINACTLHYGDNNDHLQRDKLLLIDIGARVDGYAADITRTYALGQPTKRQIQIHSAIQAAHNQIIDLLRPGLRIKDYQNSVNGIMKKALMSIGVMESVNDDKAYRHYFPHAISHGLGIDVHDSLGRPEEFLPGMVLTVEPGVYIPQESLGVRIEDDVLITEVGRAVLSGKLSTDL